jgi:type II secretory pathway component PulK
MRLTAGQPDSLRRRAAVLLAVLVVIVLLTLAAYQYSDWMTAETRAAASATRSAQAQALADSGVSYAAAVLSNPDAVANTLNGNPYNNPSAFQGIQVSDGSSTQGMPGRFSVLSLVSPDDPNATSQPYRFGVTDEAGKINLNGILALDKGKGDVAKQMLMALPGMTDEASDSIIDWLDSDDTPRSAGAESDYYGAQSPPYQAKNGPLDSLEELLLVKGVTPQLLFGNDLNRNGVLDPGEDDGTGQANQGWSAFLTVYSREPNVDSTGNPRVYLNDQDLNTLNNNLSGLGLSQDVVNFIMAARMYGLQTAGSGGAGGSGGQGGSGGATGGATGGSGAGGAGATNRMSTPATTNTTRNTTTRTGGDNDADDRATSTNAATTTNAAVAMSAANRSSVMSQISGDRSRGGTAGSNGRRGGGNKNISSVWDLVTGSVNVQTTSGRNTQTVTMPSPLKDPSAQQQYMPILLDKTTTSQNADLSPRINVNTASPTVLQALQAAVTSLQDSDVQAIQASQPDWSSATAPDAIYQTPAWLLTQANLSPATLKKLDPYITARGGVYRMQVQGYFDNGTASRVEAVIDTNNGRPRVVYWRNLSELGRGFDLSSAGN